MGRRAWAWLSEPLAHDFANTIHWRGTTPVDHISDEAGLTSWLRHEPHDLPAAGPIDSARVAEVRHLRDAVRGAMIAVARGEAPAPHHVEAINQASRHHAVVRVLDPDGLGSHLHPASPGADALLGVLAAAVTSTLADPDSRTRIAFCAAPGCGSVYERSRPNQVWCDPRCGARARAERHSAKG